MSSKLIPVGSRTRAWSHEGGFTTWDVSDDVSPVDAAIAVGLDTPVTTHPIYSHTGTPIPRKVETWRDGHHIGIVGKDTYHVASFMGEPLEYAKALCYETPYTTISAGKFANGAREMMVLAWPEEVLVGGQPFQGFLIIQNSHDGSTSLSMSLTKERVFCTNQLPSLHRGAQIKLRHTKSWSVKVEEARRILDVSLAYDEEFAATMMAELTQPFTAQQFNTVVDQIAPIRDERNLLKEGRSLTMAENARDSLWASYKSADLNDVRDTVFGAKQAVYAYYDWAYSSDKSRALRSLTGSTEPNKVKAASLIDSLV